MGIISLDDSEIFAALALLFSTDKEKSGILLKSIKEPELRKAYRKKALQTHPDLFMSRGEECRKLYSERFIEVSNAYDILSSYLKSRDADNGLGPIRPDPGVNGKSAGHSRHARARWGRFTSPMGRDRFPDCPSSSFWRKEVPRRHLRFAEFLYYSGLIPWKLWIRALVWQGTQRPKIGEIAQRWRWVTEIQIKDLLRDRSPGERLGDLFLNNNILNTFQLNTLLRRQRTLQTPIGEYFVQLGALRKGEIKVLLRRQLHHNSRHCARP